jgi:hypothetical protein
VKVSSLTRLYEERAQFGLRIVVFNGELSCYRCLKGKLPWLLRPYFFLKVVAMQVKLNRVIGGYLQVHLITLSNTYFVRGHIIPVNREGYRLLLRVAHVARFGGGRLRT